MNNYNADSIKILSDLNHIRKRSEMYISDNGCSHLLTIGDFTMALEQFNYRQKKALLLATS